MGFLTKRFCMCVCEHRSKGENLETMLSVGLVWRDTINIKIDISINYIMNIQSDIINFMNRKDIRIAISMNCSINITIGIAIDICMNIRNFGILFFCYSAAEL